MNFAPDPLGPSDRNVVLRTDAATGDESMAADSATWLIATGSQVNL